MIRDKPNVRPKLLAVAMLAISGESSLEVLKL
jgi:hypothetical protein